VALLLAPKPGRELRHDIRNKIRPGKNEEARPDGTSPSAA